MADLMSAAIGGLIVFIIRDHLVRRLAQLWEKHAIPRSGAEMEGLIERTRDTIHEKLDDLHGKIEIMQEELGNGFLQDLHDKIDMMEARLLGEEPRIAPAVSPPPPEDGEPPPL